MNASWVSHCLIYCWLLLPLSSSLLRGPARFGIINESAWYLNVLQGVASLKAKDIEEVDTKLLELKGSAEASDVILPQHLETLCRQVMGEVLDICFKTEDGSIKAVDVSENSQFQHVVGLVSSLASARSLHGIQGELDYSVHLASYADMLSLLKLVQLIVEKDALVDMSTIDSKDASSIVKGLAKYTGDDDAEPTIRGLTDLEMKPLIAWFTSKQTSELAMVSKEKALQHAQPAMAAMKEIVVDLFKGTVAVPDHEGLERWSKYESEVDIPAALGLLRSLPGNSLLVLQMEFVSRMATFMSTMSKLGLGRKISAKRPMCLPDRIKDACVDISLAPTDIASRL